ncbi:MAG: hypothetical protein ABIV06_04140, partial [Thermoanaerobaculia bacterium]
MNWQSRAAPLQQGVESAGIFSLAGGAAAEAAEWIALGGDFKADREPREARRPGHPLGRRRPARAPGLRR